MRSPPELMHANIQADPTNLNSSSFYASILIWSFLFSGTLYLTNQSLTLIEIMLVVSFSSQPWVRKRLEKVGHTLRNGPRPGAAGQYVLLASSPAGSSPYSFNPSLIKRGYWVNVKLQISRAVQGHLSFEGE